MIMVSFPVEVWRQPRVPDTGSASFDCVVEPRAVTDVDRPAGRPLGRRRGRRGALAGRRSSSRATASSRSTRPTCRRRATEIDLGDVTLLPGPDGHGDQPPHRRTRDRVAGPPLPCTACRTTPCTGRCARTVNARTTLLAGFTTVRNLGLMVKTGGYLLDVALASAIDDGWVVGPRVIPAAHAITPTGGHLDPTMFQRIAPRRPAAERRGGHRQRRARGTAMRALPDQARRAGHQDLGVGRRHVAQRRGRRAAVLRRGARARSSTRRTAPACASPPTPTATPASAPASAPASTASSTARSPPTTRSR